jgi:F-type H+-transporting ATPase subunit a
MFQLTNIPNFSLAVGEMPEIAPRVLWQFWGINFTETMLSGAITVLLLIVVAAFIRIFGIPRWKKKYKSMGAVQTIVESLVEGVNNNVQELVLHHTNGRFKFLSFWYHGVVCYIFVGTMIEVFGLRPPTASLSLTLAFAIFTFLFIHILGLIEAKANKRFAKRLLHYVNPINLITDSVVPFSMSMRLFISVFSGYLIMRLLYSIPFPIGYPAIGNIIFTLFHALIQSYVFFVLSTSFIAEGVE